MKNSALLFIVFIFLVSCSSDGEKISFGNLDVYYTEGVTKAEATDVGHYLNGIGFGVADVKEKLQLSKSSISGRYTCKFVMRDGIVSLENIWKGYGKSISEKVLNGVPVDVHLCDDNFNTLEFLMSDN